MASYRVCNLILQSEVPLPELGTAEERKADCVFSMLQAGDGDASPFSWLREWHFPNGDLWLQLAREGSDYLLRFHGLADFSVSLDGNRIRCQPVLNTPMETVRHLLLDQVIPMMLSMRADLVLHGSAVLGPNGAIAFLGSSGYGKSTLAASFSAEGLSMLTDDCLLLEEREGAIWGVPSYPGVRLWDDVLPPLFGPLEDLPPVAHYTLKKRLGPDSRKLPFSSAAAPFKAIFMLTPPEEVQSVRGVEITPLSSRDAFMQLVKNAYFLDVSNRDRMQHEFDFVGKVAGRVPLFRLSYCRDLDLLPVVRKAILQRS